MLALRFTQKPLNPPSYKLPSVPPPSPNLATSYLTYGTSREKLLACMAEQILLCNEATRRHGVKSSAAKAAAGEAPTSSAPTSSDVPPHCEKPSKPPSKPLSLDYISDRLDIDDPLFSYLLRSKSLPTPEGGMLQGFITATTFTNWQETFRFDSTVPDSMWTDADHPVEGGTARGKIMEREMNDTVRMGDPWNEGIVYPRIAEISLLGALKVRGAP